MDESYLKNYTTANLAGQMYQGPRECANQIDSTASDNGPTLAKNVERLSAALHSIADNVIAIKMSLYGPQLQKGEVGNETPGSIAVCMTIAIRIAEAIAEETAALRHKIG